jgi:hypothetical protein
MKNIQQAILSMKAVNSNAVEKNEPLKTTENIPPAALSNNYPPLE